MVSQEEAGCIVFFDAHYCPSKTADKEQEPPLHPDVMTVHHPHYYQGAQAPNDKQSPVPIPFLSATGQYLLALAAPDLEHNESWLTFTFELLAQALMDNGIGAKTSSGYGRMEIEGVLYVPPTPRPESASASDKDEPFVASVDPIALKIEGHQRELNALPINGSLNGQMHGYYVRWKEVKEHSQSIELARAIVAKVRTARIEKNFREKAWYKEVLAVINESSSR